ncbi:MAG: NAD-dependent epimerase/dehydratase family protein [Lysobacteraceae bacterium]
MDSRPDSAPPSPVFVLGGSGAVGRFLLRRLAQQAQPALALSRRPSAPAWAASWPSVAWRQGDLATLREAGWPATEWLLSVGPLDALAAACVRGLPAGLRRVVALSSLSIRWKGGSPNPAERALVERLLAAETSLRQTLAKAGVDLCLLRPGLIYGAGIDRSLSPLLRAARRWRRLPWPRAARGLRAPVHADDVAAAVLAALALPAAPPAAEALLLPGPRALPFDRLIDEMLHALAPGARRLAVPVPLSACALAARLPGRIGGFAAMLRRSALDQCAEDAGWDTLGLHPRPFRPREEDFTPWRE